MANQFTKGTRKAHDESTKDKIRAEVLSRRMYKFAKAKPDKRDELDMTQAQVAAAKVLIERGKPALQAVTQTITEEPKSEAELMAQLDALLPTLLADPGARARAEAILSGSPAVVDTQQRTAQSPNNEENDSQQSASG